MFGKLPRSTNDLAVLELDKDKLFNLLEYGLPLHWQQEMVLHNFDPGDQTLQELVSFCKRLELTKPHDPNNSANSNSSGKSPTGTNNNKPNNRKQKTEENTVRFSGNKFCSLHGQGNHSSDECYAIKKMVKDHKASIEANQINQNKKQKSTSFILLLMKPSRTSTTLSLSRNTRNQKVGKTYQ